MHFKHLNFGQHKFDISHTYHFALYMHTCITCIHVCTRICDCSDSLIMALLKLKYGSFYNIDYRELSDTVSL